jgi:hypothetical protein
MNDRGAAMNDRKPEYLAPALIAGAVSGVLSGIPLVNCLCCLWIIGGAVLASSLLAKNTAGPLTAGDGAIVGALTGIAAAVVDSLISVLLRPVNEAFFRKIMDSLARFSDQMPARWQELMQRSTAGGLSVSGFLFGLFFSAALFAALGVLGGVIGVSIFGRKKNPAAQPPPQGPTDATA